MNLVGRIQSSYKKKYYFYLFIFFVLTEATGCLTLGMSVLVDTAVTVPVPLVLAPVSIGSISLFKSNPCRCQSKSGCAISI